MHLCYHRATFLLLHCKSWIKYPERKKKYPEGSIDIKCNCYKYNNILKYSDPIIIVCAGMAKYIFTNNYDLIKFDSSEW